MYRLGGQATLCFVVSLLCCRLSSTTATVTFQVSWKRRGHAGSWMRGGHGDDLTECSAAHVVCAPHTRRRRFPDSLRTGEPWRTGKKKAGRFSVAPTPSASCSIQVSARPEGLRADDQPGLVRRSPHAARNSGMRIPGGGLRRRRLPGSLSETREGTQARRRRHSGDGRPELPRPPAGDAGQRAVLPPARAPRHQTATSSRMRKTDTARIRSRSG